MPPILTRPLDLFSRNPIFLASLEAPWVTSTQADENMLLYKDEARLFLQDIEKLSEHYDQEGIDHLPTVFPSQKLSTIASPNFREISEILAIIRLITIRRLLPMHVQVSKIIQRILVNLYPEEKLRNAKVHSLIKENGDFETIIFAGPSDNDPYFFIELLSEGIEEYLGSEHRHNQLDCPSMTIDYRNEENEERASIEIVIGHSKIIIRDLSSQCYQKDFNPSKPFNVKGESSSFRSKFLTDQLLFLVLLLPQMEKEFPQDVYPFIVRWFFRITKTERLLDLQSLHHLQQIEEEHLLWNEFLSFCQKPENLFKILRQAQKRLRGFGDYDCIQTDIYGNHSVYEGSEDAEACKNLVGILCPKSVSEGLEERNENSYDFFLENALI